MGLWTSGRAQAIAVDFGKAFLNRELSDDLGLERVFTSPYHIAFLFRMLVYPTAAQLQKEPDDKDVLKGVAFASDELRNIYFGKPNELTQLAGEKAFSDDPIAKKARDDVDLIMAASFGDERSEKKLKNLIKKHPVWGDASSCKAMAEAGLDLDQTTTIALSMFFFDALDD